MDPRKKLRQMVSLKKKRYQDGDFDLDLAYITDRIIAFGFPAEGRESLFRNPMEECQRFFETKHKDHYYVYNLCIERERQYNPKKFHGRVGKYQWADHNAPHLEMIPAFCTHADNWMKEDDENVVCVHCKAGKGRTGVLICCLLLYQQKFKTAEEAMTFYGEQRTHNGKGVTIPSQIRFIKYYEHTLTHGMPDPAHIALLKQLEINHISTFEQTDFGVGVECNGKMLYFKTIQSDSAMEFTKSDDSITINMRTMPVTGNTKVILFSPGKKKEPMCWFWFHCAYVKDTLHMEKHEIDKAVGDKEHKIYPPDFSITARFQVDDLSEVYDTPNGKEKEKSKKKSHSRRKKRDKKDVKKDEKKEETKEEKEEDSKEAEEKKEEEKKEETGGSSDNEEKESKKEEKAEEKKENSEEKEEKEEEKAEEKSDKKEKEKKEKKEKNDEEKKEDSVEEKKSEEKAEKENKEADKKEKDEKKEENKTDLKSSDGKKKKSSSRRERHKKKET